MEPGQEMVHPNWRALASVPFDRKIFVKAKSDVFESEAKAKRVKEFQSSQVKGSEARAFYESVLNEPSTSKNNVPSTSKSHKKQTSSQKSIQDYQKSNSVIEKIQFQVRKSDLFKAVEQDNIEYVKEALEIEPHWKDLRDTYGWSLLMISCKAGSVQVTQHLINVGADK